MSLDMVRKFGREQGTKIRLEDIANGIESLLVPPQDSEGGFVYFIGGRVIRIELNSTFIFTKDEKMRHTFSGDNARELYKSQIDSFKQPSLHEWVPNIPFSLGSSLRVRRIDIIKADFKKDVYLGYATYGNENHLEDFTYAWRAKLAKIDSRFIYVVDGKNYYFDISMISKPPREEGICMFSTLKSHIASQIVIFNPNIGMVQREFSF